MREISRSQGPRAKRRAAAIGAAAAVLAAVIVLSVAVGSGSDPGRSEAKREAEPARSVHDAAGGRRQSDAHASLIVEIGFVGDDTEPEWQVEVSGADDVPRRQSGVGRGQAKFWNLAPGQYRVVLDASGFVGAAEKLEVDIPRTRLRLELRAWGAIAGTVVAQSSGLPLAGVVVRTKVPVRAAPELMIASRIRGERPPDLSTAVETDQSGRFVLRGLIPADGYSLNFYHPSFRPTSVEGIEVTSGSPVEIDAELVDGAFLTGRVFDFSGLPAARAKVHFLKRARHGWLVEAETVTDDRGAFRSPALVQSVRKQVKVWIRREGIDQIAQRVVTMPAQGELDIGELRPVGSLVTLQIEEPATEVSYRLDISAIGTSRDVDEQLERWVSLSEVEFDDDGRLAIAGLPVGFKVSYRVSTDESTVAKGGFQIESSSVLVTIHVSGDEVARNQPRSELKVDVAARRSCWLLVVRESGAIVARRRLDLPAGGGESTTSFRVVDGEYMVYAVDDELSADGPAEVPGGESRLRLVPSRAVQVAPLRVVRSGDPKSNASIYVVGFDGPEEGVPQLPWAKTDADGRARLTLPAGVARFTLVVVDEDGIGRRVRELSPEAATGGNEILIELEPDSG